MYNEYEKTDETDILKEIREDDKKRKRNNKQVKTHLKLRQSKHKIIDPLVSGLLIILLLSVGVFYCAEQYVGWRESHQWQFPVKWIGLVKEIKRTVLSVNQPELVMTDIEIMEQYKLAPVLKSIYLLESTSGKNDSCKAEGKVNGYGYRQNSRENKCYDDFGQLTGFVNEWFEDRLSVNGNNLNEAICYYNTGNEYLTTCGDYSENFWSVIANNF